jgi:AAA domain
MELRSLSPAAPPGPAALVLPPAAMLVVAGVPGAGKTTLLSRVDTAGSRVLDPEPIRARYARLLGRVPYRLWRPLVHAEHYLRLLLALQGRAGLVVHETGTRAWRRRLLASTARRFGRTAHLLLLDVTAEAALQGQRRRRRAVRRGAFSAHWRRWQALRAALTASGGEAGLAAEGWASVRLVDRVAAGRLVQVDIALARGIRRDSRASGRLRGRPGAVSASAAESPGRW